MRSVLGPQTKIADKLGQITPVFFTWLAQRFGPQAIVSVTPGASPFTYQAQYNGSLNINGGTISAVAYSRDGSTFYATQTAGMIPISGGDYIKITYTVAPTLTFIPQ